MLKITDGGIMTKFTITPCECDDLVFTDVKEAIFTFAYEYESARQIIDKPSVWIMRNGIRFSTDEMIAALIDTIEYYYPNDVSDLDFFDLLEAVHFVDPLSKYPDSEITTELEKLRSKHGYWEFPE
jgi:hypothetical protein